jgi:hypothetical protein
MVCRSKSKEERGKTYYCGQEQSESHHEAVSVDNIGVQYHVETGHWWSDGIAVNVPVAATGPRRNRTANEFENLRSQTFNIRPIFAGNQQGMLLGSTEEQPVMAS